MLISVYVVVMDTLIVSFRVLREIGKYYTGINYIKTIKYMYSGHYKICTVHLLVYLTGLLVISSFGDWL